MNKYKCPKCKLISTGTEWDEVTDAYYNNRDYGDDSKINSKNRCDYHYVCPKCENILIDGLYIIEIDESIEVI